MGARQKLNQAFFNGALVVASVAGTVCESWIMFGAVFVALLVFNVRNRQIRFQRSRRR